MCGIAGLYVFNDKIEAPEKILMKMVDMQYHRGPDAFGSYVDSGMYMGHRRLSIIDLSQSAGQPMQNEKYSIVFNGEVYNLTKTLVLSIY